MQTLDFSVDTDRAVDRLLHFLSIEGVTGEEAAIGKAVVQALLEAGIPRRAIRFDQANKRIPLPTQTGNLIVTLPGTRSGPRRLLMAHLDTVPLCAGARPQRKGNRIVAGGPTALGGDDRTGVACLVNAAATLREQRLPHPPLTLLFTVREESGLWGARHVNPAELGHPREAFNFDGRSASELTIGAVGAERWQVEVFGKAAHAGVHPEQGISATMVASLALAQAYQDGWFGKISKDGREGTANVGSFGGTDGRSAGVATNVVTDHAILRGESRSHDRRFVRTISKAYRDAFHAAAKQVCDDRGRCAKVRFETRHDYHPFRLALTEPVVRHALTAAEWAGLKPTVRVTNGGLDANWLVRHGIPTVTLGAGQNNIHTAEEFVDLAEFANGCRMALAVATLDAAS
ncbi:MAG TPA: M20/M25/M40 family metallo-hydrolase [Gemmataceae bacterium]|nr:M20/M25/M40 family metallo-hydrolase [Gemmataceae bacterium]